MALNAKTDPNYVPKRINGKFAPGWTSIVNGLRAKSALTAH